MVLNQPVVEAGGFAVFRPGVENQDPETNCNE